MGLICKGARSLPVAAAHLNVLCWSVFIFLAVESHLQRMAEPL